MTTTPPPPDDPSVPDDVWARFMQDTEAEIRASAPKEPSARARMVTERLRRQDEEAARRAKRRGRGTPLPARPEGWRTGPAVYEVEERGSRRRRWLGLAGVLVAAGVLLFALNPGWALDALRGSGGGSADPEPTPLPVETAKPTGAPSQEAFPDTPTLKDPFAGSPAKRYADGAEGIVPPKARPAGWMTSAQVTAALKKVKAYLVDTNLDPATLRGERPDDALGMLDPSQRELRSRFETAFRKPTEKNDPLRLAVRFKPSEVVLAGDVVKTRGRMTFTKGKDRAVVVHADYTFVYPVVKAEPESTEVARTIIRRILDVEFPDPSRYRVTPGKFAITRYDDDVANSACFVHDGWLHPQFASDASSGDDAGRSGPTVDPYDRSRDLKAERSRFEGCGTVSRT
ncbi:hypothetical protein [Actinacidiphila sp. bgisy160]|uniref:hypothetical protein n=1 Tax=Actinacidiphila sp. bgisy160 TaxID=3413796 RepID=UPI003D734FA4